MIRSTLGILDPLLPSRAELRPFRSLLFAASTPNRDQHWTGAGALATWASRLVDPDELEAGLPAVIEAEQEHVAHTYECLRDAARALTKGDTRTAAQILLALAAREEDRDRIDLAEGYAAAACEVLGSEHSGIASLARRRWARALRGIGRHADAVREYYRSHEVALDVGDRRGAAEGAIGAGNTLEEEGQWQGARQWYERALEIVSLLDQPVPEQWHAQLNLHVVLRSVSELERSRSYLDDAAATASLLADPSARQHIENARGQLAMAEGDPESAILHFRDALLATTVTYGIVVIRLNLSEALLATGRVIEAAEEARKAEVRAIEAALHIKLPEVYRMLGRIAASEGNADALVFFEHALATIRLHELPELERAITLQAYADAEARVGEADTATALYTEADDIYRRLGITGRRSEWADTFGTEA
jgi:tetratricopeptide (TPR) repeat protein